MEEGNRYEYVGGDVVNRVDPSGMIGERPEQWDGCGGPPQQTQDDCGCSMLFPDYFSRRTCQVLCQRQQEQIREITEFYRAECRNQYAGLVWFLLDPTLFIEMCVEDRLKRYRNSITVPPGFGPTQFPNVTIEEGIGGATAILTPPCIGESYILYRVTQGSFTVESDDVGNGPITHYFSCPNLPNPSLDGFSCENSSLAFSSLMGVVRWTISALGAEFRLIACNGVVLASKN